MKRFPPIPILTSLMLKTILVWALPRAILTAGAGAMAAKYNISSDLSPMVLVLLAIGVAWLILFDATRSRIRVFAQNLGVAPALLFGLALGTVLICELVLAFAPGFLPFLEG